MRFTPIALIVVSLGRACTLAHVYAVGYCMLWGVAASFALAYLLDRTAYARLAARQRMSLPVFHVGNALVHAVPLVLAPRPAERGHGALAAAAHVGWGRCVSPALCLDEVYVPMERWQWRVLWLAAVGAELAAGVYT
jgi:hypothetical protein